MVVLVVVGVASSCFSRLQLQHLAQSWSRSSQSPEGRRPVIMWNSATLVRQVMLLVRQVTKSYRTCLWKNGTKLYNSQLAKLKTV